MKIEANLKNVRFDIVLVTIGLTKAKIKWCVN